MPNTKPLTTGQVSGLLGIPSCTLQRYVREFRKHFSESARITNRGRRWTADDIDTLMIIRKMHQSQEGLQAIDQALENCHSSPAAEDPRPEVMDSFTLLATAAAVLEEVRAERAKVQALVLDAKWSSSQYKNFEGWVGRNIVTLRQEINKLDQAYYKLGSIYKNPYRKYQVAKPYRRLWSEFVSWTKRNILDDVESLQDQPFES
jgi:DNA-binding transcriptional MerR regulator